MNDELKTKAIAGTLWSQVGKFAEFFLLLLLSVVLARGLGPEEYGIYVSLVALLGLIELASSMGFEQTLSNFIPRRPYSEQGRLLRKILLLRIVLLGSLLSFVVILGHHVSLWYFDRADLSHYFMVAAVYIFFKNITTLTSFYYIGNLQTRFVSTVNTFSLAASVGVAAFLIEKGFGIFEILTGFGVIYVLALFAYVWKRKDLISHAPAEREGSRQIWLFSRTVWINNTLGYMLGKQSDIFMLQWFSIGLVSIGFYNVAYTLVNSTSTLMIAGLMTVSLPVMSGLFAKGELDKLAKSWRLIVSFGILFSLPALVFLLINARKVMIFFFSDSYADAALLLQVFALFSIAGRLIGGGANTTLLYSMNKERVTFYATAITGVANIVLNLILIPIYGAVGALIATGISGTATSGVLLWAATKSVKLRFPLLFSGKVFFSAMIAGWASSLVVNYSSVGLILSFVAFCLLYVGILSLLKPLEREDAQSFVTVPRIYRCVTYFSEGN